MKKTFLGVAVILIFFCTNVLAFSRFDTNEVLMNNKDLDLIEEVSPISSDGIIEGFDLTIVIPENYDKDVMVISPSIFECINNYKRLIPGDLIYVNLKIINKSNYNYKYKKDSFKISTLDLSMDRDVSNYSVIGRGFDQLNIYNNFSINRVYNEAISSLYNDSYKANYLEDDVLNSKLLSIGYSLDSIDKYFLDYYNNKYNLKEEDLNNFTYSVIKEIFTGEISDIVEVNRDINSLAYNYYYNKLLYILPDGISIDQFESDNYSIGEYMRNQKLTYNFKFNDIDSLGVLNINNIRIGINKYYYSSVFDNYNLAGHLEFLFEKDQYITPPNTGI